LVDDKQRASMANFASHTPEAVRRLIEEHLAIPQLAPRLRAAIERLAGNEEMENLWNTQVPPQLCGREPAIIEWAIGAYRLATSVRPPIKNWLRDYAEFRRSHPDPITNPVDLAAYKERFVTPPDYAMLAGRARFLLEGMNEIPSRTRAVWGEIWPGDPAMTFDGVTSTIEAIAVCCDHLGEVAADMRAALQLPDPPRKRGARTAPRVFFDRIMKQFFRSECGRPNVELVAILEQVLFDLPGSVDESTVRKR
jgi:hypothetical protein